MSIMVVTANLGNIDNFVPYTKQSVDHDFHMFTDSNFPIRHNSMTPRLQARIPKMFSWQILPGYDYYLWIDASYSLQNPDSVKWFVEQCEGVDMAVLRHPMRNSIHEEADYIRNRLGRGCEYITPRYSGEFMDEQLKVIDDDDRYVDNRLFASGFIIYRDSQRVRDMMTQWWYHTSRYTNCEQLSFPYVIYKSGCRVNDVPVKHRHDFGIPYVTLTRYL
jgi:hypothetical protein